MAEFEFPKAEHLFWVFLHLCMAIIKMQIFKINISKNDMHILVTSFFADTCVCS